MSQEKSGKQKQKVSKEFLDSLKNTPTLPTKNIAHELFFPPMPSPEEAKRIVEEMKKRGHLPPPYLLPPEQAKVVIEELKKRGIPYPPPIYPIQQPVQNQSPKKQELKTSIVEQIQEDDIEKIAYVDQSRRQYVQNERKTHKNTHQEHIQEPTQRSLVRSIYSRNQPQQDSHRRLQRPVRGRETIEAHRINKSYKQIPRYREEELAAKPQRKYNRNTFQEERLAPYQHTHSRYHKDTHPRFANELNLRKNYDHTQFKNNQEPYIEQPVCQTQYTKQSKPVYYENDRSIHSPNYYNPRQYAQYPPTASKFDRNPGYGQEYPQTVAKKSQLRNITNLNRYQDQYQYPNTKNDQPRYLDQRAELRCPNPKYTNYKYSDYKYTNPHYEGRHTLIEKQPKHDPSRLYQNHYPGVYYDKARLPVDQYEKRTYPYRQFY